MTPAEYEIRPSARRTRTIAAFREDGRLIVAVPARMSARARRELIPGLVERFLAKEGSRRPPRAEDELTDRLLRLYARYLRPGVGGEPPAVGVRWVANQGKRWGSCSPATGEIRISDRLRDFPAWVVDAVLVHEAAHLIELHHTARFKELVGRYPDTDRAMTFLEGYEFARSGSATVID